MRVAIIGRSELMYNTAIAIHNAGHEIPLIITSKPAPEYARTDKDFEQLAEQLNADYEYTIRLEEVQKIIEVSNVDIAVSINFTGIISEKIISLFPLGILNVHGGDLPRYRGNACQAWAILNGEKRIGLCVHKMVGGELDSGPILTKEFYEIDINTTITEVWDWMLNRSPSLVLCALERLHHNPAYILETQSLNPAHSLRCYPRRPEDGLIDWRQSAESVHRLVNASCAPFSGAFTFLNGEKCTVLKTEILDIIHPYCAVPGQIMSRDNSGVEVACGMGAIKITKMCSVKISSNDPFEIVKSVRERFNSEGR